MWLYIIYHLVHLQSKLVSDMFPVAICPALSIKGVKFLSGNDIADGKVTPALEVQDNPQRYGGPCSPRHKRLGCSAAIH